MSQPLERSDRSLAILAMAGRHMKRLSVEDLEALCELADADETDLASMVLNPALYGQESGQ